METGWAALREGGPEAWVAIPERPARAAVVVGMEVFGVTGHVRAACERLARAGHVAVAPDLHWRHGRRRALAYDGEGRAEAMALTRRLTREEALSDVLDARAHALARAGGSAAAAFVGFSLGGHVATLAATRIPFALAVSVYGGWTLDGGVPLAAPAPPLAEAAAMARLGVRYCAVAGTRDALVGPDELRRIGERLREAGVAHEIVALEGAAHGFACEERPATYDEAAAAAAWERILGWLEEVTAAPGR